MSARAHDFLAGSTARDIAHSVSTAVRAGHLVGGARLPTVRQTADELNVSPATVSAAWGLLLRAGVIETDGRRGTRVRSTGVRTPRRYRRALDRGMSFARDLSTGMPDPALLPDLRLSLRNAGHLRSTGSYLDEPVLPELTAALRADWPYEPETIAILDGAMDALDQIVSCHLRYGDRVAVEQPAFAALLDLLDAFGIQQIPVHCDRGGPITESLASALKLGVRAFFFQPRAQNPSGASLSGRRAGQLAALLRRHADVLLVEDDSVGGIATSTDVSLGRWLPDSVLHIRSFSKSHGPDLRLAAVSGTQRALEPVLERRNLGQGWSSRLLQAVLLDMLTNAPVRAQISAARAEYARRREQMITALRVHGIVLPPGDGLNLWLPVADETSALLYLSSRGVGAAAGAPFWIATDPAPYVRITVGLVREGFEELAGLIAGGVGQDRSSGPW